MLRRSDKEKIRVPRKILTSDLRCCTIELRNTLWSDRANAGACCSGNLFSIRTPEVCWFIELFLKQVSFVLVILLTVIKSDTRVTSIAALFQEWFVLRSSLPEKMIQREQAEHQSKLMASRDRPCSEDTILSYWTVTETLSWRLTLTQQIRLKGRGQRWPSSYNSFLRRG